jgi:hypothetical protein
MPGSYSGTPHGGNEFTGQTSVSDVFALNRVRKQQAQANIIAASQGGTRTVVSADGKRILYQAPPPRPTGSGAGHRSVGVGGSSGPGASYVGEPGMTKGPGSGGSRLGAEPVGSGPGLGVITVGPAFDWEYGKSTRTPIQIGGSWVPIDEGFSDGGDFEQRWGEFGGSVAGLGVMAADGWKWAASQFGEPDPYQAQKNVNQYLFGNSRPMGAGGDGW